MAWCSPDLEYHIIHMGILYYDLTTEEEENVMKSVRTSERPKKQKRTTTDTVCEKMTKLVTIT